MQSRAHAHTVMPDYWHDPRTPRTGHSGTVISPSVTGSMRELYGFELGPEVRDWLDSLSDSDYKRVDEVCGLLAEKGSELGGRAEDLRARPPRPRDGDLQRAWVRRRRPSVLGEGVRMLGCPPQTTRVAVGTSFKRPAWCCRAAAGCPGTWMGCRVFINASVRSDCAPGVNHARSGRGTEMG
jgi:hypothetical protein